MFQVRVTTVLSAFLLCCLCNVNIAQNQDSVTSAATTYAANNGQQYPSSATYGSGFSYQRPFAYNPQQQQQQQQYYTQQLSAQNAFYPQQNYPAAAGFQNLPYFPQFPNFGGGGFPGAFQPFQPFTPVAPVLTPTEFNEALNKYVTSVQKQYANYNGGSFAWSTPGATASAYTNMGPLNVYEQQQKQWEAWRNNLLANSQTPNAAYAPPNVATATGGIGQDGNIQQTVSLLPENAANPNVKVQHTVTGGPGYVGVSTASFSSTSDVNGVQTQRKGAYTTVNDNGKITTYKLE